MLGAASEYTEMHLLNSRMVKSNLTGCFEAIGMILRSKEMKEELEVS